jgi:hypothetical protein
MVESPRDSMSHSLSQGRCVPKPLRRAQALSFSQSTLFSNSMRNSSGMMAIFLRHPKTWAFHSGSEYSRNHWSLTIIMTQRVPQRQMTGVSLNS